MLHHLGQGQAPERAETASRWFRRDDGDADSDEGEAEDEVKMLTDTKAMILVIVSPLLPPGFFGVIHPSGKISATAETYMTCDIL